MANKIYFSKTVLIGGSAPALDILDGTNLVAGDFAFAVIGDDLRPFKLADDSSESELSPSLIKPDSNPGNLVWRGLTVPRDLLWTKIRTNDFTATPASTSTITMGVDHTANIKVGMSLKYVIGGTTYYGRVAAIAAALLTVNGAPLSGDVTALYYGGGTVRQIQLIIPDYYEDASNTALIASDLKSSIQWGLPLSYLVYFRVYSNVHDTGTHGQASVRINNTEVNTVAGGLTIAADATWYSTVVDIAVAAYDINPGEAIEITAVKAGNGDARDLTVEMIFVTP